MVWVRENHIDNIKVNLVLREEVKPYCKEPSGERSIDTLGNSIGIELTKNDLD